MISFVLEGNRKELDNFVICFVLATGQPGISAGKEIHKDFK